MEEGSLKYNEKAVSNSRQVVVLQLQGFKKLVAKCHTGPRNLLMVASCENDNELSGSIKGGQFLG
jgi:hypothetical protein